AGLVVAYQHRLHDVHRDQLGIGDPRGHPDRWPPPVELRGRLHLVVDPDVQCGREGVQIDVHVASMVSLRRQRRSWAPSRLRAVPYPLESIIWLARSPPGTCRQRVASVPSPGRSTEAAEVGET